MTYCALYSDNKGWGVYSYSKQSCEFLRKADSESRARQYASNLKRNLGK